MKIIGLHVDPTVSLKELAELRATTPESGDHLWAIDSTARVVTALSPNGIADLVIFNKLGKLAFRGSFPQEYTQLKSMVENEVRAN